MTEKDLEIYEKVRTDGGYIELPRGLIAVSGKEAVPFLDGMITNDMKTLEDGAEMRAAFPNAQGRLLAVVRVRRDGERFLIESEAVTKEKVFQNLFRFTFAGDFFVEDWSDNYTYSEFFHARPSEPENSIVFTAGEIESLFTPVADGSPAVGARLSPELYETLRIESGIPLYGVDMDESTIVPELGFEEMISYKKGCYIGQEIIARIHFRGHVAKRLTGLTIDKGAGIAPGAELATAEGKSAGRITSLTFSPVLGKTIALGFVRYDYLAPGTELMVGERSAVVTELPFVK